MKQIDGVWTNISPTEVGEMRMLCRRARKVAKIYELAGLKTETSLARDVAQLYRFFNGTPVRVRTKHLRKLKKFGDTFPEYVFAAEAKVLAQINY